MAINDASLQMTKSLMCLCLQREWLKTLRETSFWQFTTCFVYLQGCSARCWTNHSK